VERNHRKPPASRLLLVDDEHGIRESLSALFRRYGFRVTVASSVSQALDEMAKQGFDLLLCDLNLEREADGFNVIRAMRQLYPNCVIVILTDYPALATATEGMQRELMSTLQNPQAQIC